MNGYDSISSHAAVGLWVADPRGSVPEPMIDEWSSAVLRGDRKEYWLGEIFKAHPDLGCAFLRKEILSDDHFWACNDHAVREALKSIAVDHRRQLMHELPEKFWSGETVAMLIGDSAELYRELLSTQRLEQNHLAPLRGAPNEGNWIAMAKTALDAGIAPKDVAAAPLRAMLGWTGNDSEMWKGWMEAFETIAADEDERIRQVATHGIAMAKAHRENALSEERAEETYGRPW